MEDKITLHKGGGMSVTGEFGMQLYKAITLKQALLFYSKTKMQVSRNVTPTVMFNIAKEFTGKTYKRGQYELAAADVQVWIDTAKAAIPVEDERES